MEDREKLSQIYSLMRNLLLCPNGVNSAYRSIKNTSRKQCYEVLGKIQEILETNKVYINVTKEQN